MRADRDSVRRKLKIARGQLDGILQMIDDDRYCVDISNQLLATQSLLKSANQQIMRAHIEGCGARLCRPTISTPSSKRPSSFSSAWHSRDRTENGTAGVHAPCRFLSVTEQKPLGQGALFCYTKGVIERIDLKTEVCK